MLTCAFSCKSPRPLCTWQPPAYEWAGAVTGCSDGSAFEPVAGLVGANTTSALDNSDDTTELIVLPFEFNWLGIYPVTVVRVSTNGFINVDKNNTPSANDMCCDGVPIVENSTPSRISVLHEDLHPGNGGTIFLFHNTTSTPESFVVSWEEVDFYDSFRGEANAQIVL